MLKNKFYILGIVFVLVLLLLNIVSAGVGIKWDSQSRVVKQGGKTCLTYSVYNPWPKDSYAIIQASGDVEQIIQSQQSESKLIPANTPSSEAIPIKFCFEVPYVYAEGRDCLLGDYVCEQKCSGEQKEYSGEILVTETGGPLNGGGSGGSATSMSVSAPISVKVKCDAHSRDYGLVYGFVAMLSLIVIVSLFIKKYRKPKWQRDQEKLQALKKKVREEKKHTN